MSLILELHDSEQDSLSARIGKDGTIEYDYQAEQWVQETAPDRNHQDPHPGRWVVRWVLKSPDGSERAVWERPSGDTGLPKLVRVSSDFRGEWVVGT